MGQPTDKIKESLDETRMLTLGAQVLLAVEWEAVFEHGFAKLPAISRYLNVTGTALMLIVILLFMAPVAYDRIVPVDANDADCDAFVTAVIKPALLPFALSLGFGMYIGTRVVAGRAIAAAVGIFTLGFALFFWYGLEALTSRKRRSQMQNGIILNHEQKRDGSKGAGPGAGKGPDGKPSTQVSERISHVLTEARVVLPGAQALLGFQIVVMLTQVFEKLPAAPRIVHLASLGFVAITVIILMTPAAYHRIVDQGEDTEEFYRFASRMVVASMVPLPLGLCTDFYVAADIVIRSPAVSATISALLLALFYGFWFGYMMIVRRNRLVDSIQIAR